MIQRISNKNKEKFLNLKCFSSILILWHSKEEGKEKLECNSDETITKRKVADRLALEPRELQSRWVNPPFKLKPVNGILHWVTRPLLCSSNEGGKKNKTKQWKSSNLLLTQDSAFRHLSFPPNCIPPELLSIYKNKSFFSVIFFLRVISPLGVF